MMPADLWTAFAEGFRGTRVLKRHAVGKAQIKLEEADRRFREVVGQILEADGAYLLETLTVEPAARAHAIGKLYASGRGPATTEPLIDAEAGPALTAFLVGLLPRDGGFGLGP
jgi:hypothetical protein